MCLPGLLLTYDEVPDEERLLFLIIFQHALEVLLDALHRRLPAQLCRLPLWCDNVRSACKVTTPRYYVNAIYLHTFFSFYDPCCSAFEDKSILFWFWIRKG